jgi:hypothetical protein
MPTPQQHGVSQHRRWLMPAIVLVVGGALAIWGIQRENARLSAIEDQVRRWCRHTASKIDLAGAFNPRNSTVDGQVGEALRSVIRTRDDADLVSIRVRPGDSETVGSISPRATHTATLAFDNQDLLGLRIECDDPTQPITVLGYWTP